MKRFLGSILIDLNVSVLACLQCTVFYKWHLPLQLDLALSSIDIGSSSDIYGYTQFAEIHSSLHLTQF